MDAFQTLLALTAFVLGIMMWSYALFGDNYAFATCEAIFLAGNAANSVFSLLQSLYAGTLVPIASGSIVFLLALILGATAFTRLTRFRWAARYATAVMSGMGIGVLFGLNIRSQILNNITSQITSISNAILMPKDVAIAGYSVPAGLILVFELLASVMIVFMVLTFSYSRIIAGKYFDPKSRLIWVSKVGRIFIMVLIGYQAGNALRGDGFNGLIRFLQVIVVRTVDAFRTGISPF